MSRLYKCLLLAGFWAMSFASSAQGSSKTDSLLSTYRLGSGDVVSIRVLGEDDLKREKIRLSDAGTISFPSSARSGFWESA